MRNQPTTIAHESATAPPRKRYRSWLYLAMHGPENHVWGLTVCTDYRMACLILSGQDHGDILIVSPDEGARVRQFLSTGKPWMNVPTRAMTGSLVSDTAKLAKCSKTLSRQAADAEIEKHGGVGYHYWRNRQTVADVFGAPV